MGLKRNRRFPRISLTSKIANVEKQLHWTYNVLSKRRGGANAWFIKKYDIYTNSRFKKTARSQFCILAKKLVQYNIPPRRYLEICSAYGQFKNNRSLPPPKWLANGGVEVYLKWLEKSTGKKYDGDFKLAGRDSVGGMEIKPVEILGAIRESSEIANQLGFTGEDLWRYLFSIRDTISIWYFACMSHEFRTSEVYTQFERSRRRHIKECRQYMRAIGIYKKCQKEAQ